MKTQMTERQRRELTRSHLRQNKAEGEKWKE
jgi:hypothetical protein